MKLIWTREYFQPTEAHGELRVWYGGTEEPTDLVIIFPLADPAIKQAIEDKDFFILQMLADLVRDWQANWFKEIVLSLYREQGDG